MLIMLAMLHNYYNVPPIHCMLTMLLQMTILFHFLFEVGSIRYSFNRTFYSYWELILQKHIDEF